MLRQNQILFPGDFPVIYTENDSQIKESTCFQWTAEAVLPHQALILHICKTKFDCWACSVGISKIRAKISPNDLEPKHEI